MFVRDVGGFADIVDEVVEFRFVEFEILVGSGFAVVTAGFTVEGAVGVGQLQFPMAIASDNSLELIDLVIEPVSLVWIFGLARFAGNDGPDVETIDAVFGEIGVNEFGDGGEEVDGHEHVFGFGAGGNFPGPAHDARFAGTTFPVGALAFAEGIGGAGVIAVAKPWAVIGGVNDPGVFFEAVAFEGVHDLADGPIDFFNDIAVKAAPGFAAEFVAHVKRDVGHVVSEVEEERAVFVRVDEFDRVLGVPGGELVLIFVRDVGDDDFVVFEHAEVGIVTFTVFSINDWPHVVGIREAEVFIEAVPQGEELRGIAEMPFAEDGGGIATLFDELGEGHFVVADADF